MKRLILTIMLILLMSGIASAEQIADWPFGQRNVMPENVTGVYYDFEEGSNCGTFINQFPNATTFIPVDLGNVPIGYGPNYPSYNTVGGSMCGTTRCYMNIWPYDNDQDWIMVVNGRAGFSPKTCCESDECWTGDCYPGTEAEVEFLVSTTYISFLASTGGSLRIVLYDDMYNAIHSEVIYSNNDRIYPGPSEFTRFEFNSQNIDIAYMRISGAFNGWVIDDMIIGISNGTIQPPTPEPTPTPIPDPEPTPTPIPDPEPTPTPEPTPEPTTPVDYSDVAEKAKTAVGAEYLEHGLGFDYRDFSYANVEDILIPPPNCAPGLNCPSGLEYWNQDTKQFEYGEGLSDEGLIIWAYNSITKELYGESVVKWETAPDMAKHDFTESVPIGEEQPGDVYFLYGGEHGALDEVGIVVDSNYVVTSRPGPTDELGGVDYHFKFSIENSGNFAGYFRLPGKITGGHNPIKKAPPSKYTSPEDYSYVENKAIELVESVTPIPYNQHALGYDYPTLSYAETQWLTDDSLDYWIPHEDGEGGAFSDAIEAHTGENIDTSGISPEGLLLWTYNYDSYNDYGRVEVVWHDLPHMLEHDFTESIEPPNVQLGDVYFWDSEFTDGCGCEKVPDRAGISVTPNIGGMDMITVTPEGGIHYNFGNAVINSAGFVGIQRVPAKVK